MATTHYALFPKVRAVEFNAHAGAYVLGVPQPTAMAGFSHAVGLKLSRQFGLKFSQAPRIAYAVSEFSGFQGKSPYPRTAHLTPSGKAGTPAPIVDRVRASVMLSLLFEFAVEDGEDAPTVEQLSEVVEASRIQSASLFIEQEPLLGDGLLELAKLLRKIPSDAFFLVDAHSVLEEKIQEQPVTWRAMSELISRPTTAGVYKPRFVPALVGWRELSAQTLDPQSPKLAEPVLGLAQFISPGAFRKKAAAEEPIFWSHNTLQLSSAHHVVQSAAPSTFDIEFF
jgi:CRISPR type I-F-associated protein Csy2